MSHKYCLDTSGLTNPLMDIPEDIHLTIWPNIIKKIREKIFYWNVEISEEMEFIKGNVGTELKDCKETCCFEIEKGDWDWPRYIEINNEWREKFRQYISEYNHYRKDTIGLTDLSIVALASTLNLPLVSMERPNFGNRSEKKMRIPELCSCVGVAHYDFNKLCRTENIKG